MRGVTTLQIVFQGAAIDSQMVYRKDKPSFDFQENITTIFEGALVWFDSRRVRAKSPTLLVRLLHRSQPCMGVLCILLW